MPVPLVIDRRAARRLCVQGQLLSAPRPASIQQVVDDLGEVQMDPTRVVARTEHLVLFSRLGRRFRVAELERMLWTDHSLFEYRAHILPMSDLAIHREEMRRYPPADGTARHTQVREWLRANASFRRYLLRELRRRGPLRSRDLEDRTVSGWRSGGWNDDPNYVPLMLEVLWRRGEVMIVGRDGQQRIWDLAERLLRMDAARLPTREVARRILDRQLRARGVATIEQFGWAFDGRPPGWERTLAEMVREGVAVPVEVRDTKGSWYAHADLLERSYRPRTVLLSPFDDLVSDRDHTEALFDFFFRLEIYVPKAKRRWGYFVLPILHGDRLIGRIDPKFERNTGVLLVNAVHAEEDARPSEGAAVARAIGELARWLGARNVTFTAAVPAMWRRRLAA